MVIEIDEELMVAEEVGAALRLRPATVYQAAADGRIPCVRLWTGRRRAVIRFRRRDIERIVREGGIAPSAERRR